MPTTYPYAAKGAPTVGKGLGGLPRRLDPVIPAPVVAPTPVGPYYLSTRGQMYNSSQTFCYSPHVTASYSFSDGTYGGQLFYLIKNGTYQYLEKSYTEQSRQIKTTGGNATTWQITKDPGSSFDWMYCLKHDLSGMVTLQASGGISTSIANSMCYEIVNGVETHYCMSYDNSSTMVLSKVVPSYATQQVQQSADAQLSFNYGAVSRRPYAIFLNGDHLYVVSGNSATNRMHLDKFNKSDLTYVSTVYWSLGAAPEAPSNGFYAETATMLAIRYQGASTAGQARAFVLDKTTLQAREFANGIGGDASWQANLLNDSNEIYFAYGAGSGGSYGFAQVYLLRSNADIYVASQSYSGATFSLASSVRCTTPRGIMWGSYFRADGVGGQNTNLKQVFIPAPDKTFYYSNSGWAFEQAWSETPRTNTSGTAITATPSTTTNPYTAQFWSFNALGTTYITL